MQLPHHTIPAEYVTSYGRIHTPEHFGGHVNTVTAWLIRSGVIASSTKVVSDVNVHSYYYDEDRLGKQNPKYSGRTRLNIGVGDVSLLLINVTVVDGGVYKCYYSSIRGNSEKYVILTPIQEPQSLLMTMAGGNGTCTAKGIYPKPDLKWQVTSAGNISVEETVWTESTEGCQCVPQTHCYLTSVLQH
uniref:Ig-like domain-containing protein n=1 Tax=Amphilophus citrinellus TaxID=61819 RepID=A0A3Q0T2H9_AMPCI